MKLKNAAFTEAGLGLLDIALGGCHPRESDNTELGLRQSVELWLLE